MKKVFALLLIAGGVLSACTKAPEVATQLEVDATELVITDDPGVKQLSIKANGPWHMEISEKWVVASKLSGSGDAVVKFGVLPNKDYSSREALITIKAGSQTKTVKLTQAQMDGILLDVDALDIDYEAGEYVIPVETNIAITAESDAPWLEVDATKGLVEKGITIRYALNPGRESREGHITISGDGLTQVFPVTQGAFEPEFNLDDEQGVGPWGTLNAPKEGLTYTFTAVTNMDFTADAPDADWIHVTKEGDVVTVVVDENPAAARAEYIYMGCSKEDVDYSDYGAMIKVKQKGQAQAEELWKMDFYWGIFPQDTRVSTAVAGDYFILYSPGAITPGFHLMNKADGTEAAVVAAPENVTGITNDEAGNVIVTTGGNFPISTETWALIPEEQIPLKVYVLTQEEFLAGTVGEPIITYYDEFYGYGLDNAQVNGNAKGDGLLTMTSGAAGGGSFVVAWEIKDGVATDTPTASASCASIGGDLWDSFHGVSIGAGTTAAEGFYFAGYLGDYNLHYTAKAGEETSWSVAFETGYTWEGAINTGDVFTYEGHRYLAVLGMNYFAYSDWGLNPCKIWVFNMDDPADPVLVINQEYWANEENWQYGSNTDIEVVEEDGMLVAYMVDVAASTYRKLEIQL